MTAAMEMTDIPARTLVIGFDEIRPSQKFLELLVRLKPFGIIFFSRNFEKFTDIRIHTKLFASIDAELEFLIDQEGGDKCRIVDAPYCPPIPWQMRDWNTKDIYGVYRDSAEALAELGITINLAPVADIGTGEYIRLRTFGDNPSHVAERVTAASLGIQVGGLEPCVKHFPGLGSAHTDPHKSLPVSDIPREELMCNHWLPFKAAITAKCKYIMTTHIIATGLDRHNSATYSSAVIGQLRALGFSEKVFTDDLSQMVGAGDLPPEKRIKNALAAGHNIALWCAGI